MAKTFSIVPVSASAPQPALASVPNPTPAAAFSTPPSPALSTDPLDLLPRPTPSAAAVTAAAAGSPALVADDDVTCVAQPSDPVEMDIGDNIRIATGADDETRPTQAAAPSIERPRKRPRSSLDAPDDDPAAPRGSVDNNNRIQFQEIPLPVQPLIQVGPRIYFAMFDGPLPSPALLNSHDGTRSAVFPRAAPKSAGMNAPPPQSLPFTPTRTEGKTLGSAWAPNTIESKFTWFTVDRKVKSRHESETLPNDFSHLSFFDDWGPLNMSLVYQFCVLMNDFLTRPALKDHGIVFYTSTRPRIKANAVALLALRMVLVEDKSPSEALHPFSTLELEPFRDAGYGKADYALSLQDVIYGTWRAVAQNNLFDIETFDISEYLYSERTVNNDWSWITPNVIAFASPDDPRFRKGIQKGLIQQSEIGSNDLGFPQDYLRLSPDTEEEENSFSVWDDMRTRLLSDFTARNVRLVVRLNDALYDRALFTNIGIDHLDLYFEDGSNPSDHILRTFLHRIRTVIDEGGVVAVHCKAGLGRTGVLIGSFLIYKYGFDANEAIAWMRLMRPGCVVGPQQHFLRNKTRTLICWAERDRSKEAELWLRKERKRLHEEIKFLTAKVHRAHTQLAEQHEDSPKRKNARSPRLPLSPRSNPATLDVENEAPQGDEAVSPLACPSSGYVKEMVGFPNPATGNVCTSSTPEKNERTHVSSHHHGPNGPVISPGHLPTPVVGQPRKSQRLPGEVHLSPASGPIFGSGETINVNTPLRPVPTPLPSPKSGTTAPLGLGGNKEGEVHVLSGPGRLPHRADELWTTHPRMRVKTGEKERMPSTPTRKPPSLTPPVLSSSKYG